MNSLNIQRTKLFILLAAFTALPSTNLFSMGQETKAPASVRPIPKPSITPKKVRNPIAAESTSVPTLPVSPATDAARPSNPPTPFVDELPSFLKTPSNFKTKNQTKEVNQHTPVSTEQVETPDSVEFSPETNKYLDLGEKLTTLKRKDRGIVHKYLGTIEAFLSTVTIPESARGIIGEINEIDREEKYVFYRQLLEAQEREYIEAQLSNTIEQWNTLNEADKNIVLGYLNYGIRGLGTKPGQQPRSDIGVSILRL